MKTAAIVLAAGKGSRMKADRPKQYLLLKEKPILYYSLKAFEESCIDEIVLVVGQGEMDYCQKEIVDKYELAKCSYGTPFYHLDICDNKSEYFQITEGLKILTSNNSLVFENGRLYFNGVCPLEPDLYDSYNCSGIFTKDIIEKAKFELFETDDDSNNHDDEDRFLILNKSEFKVILDELQNYYDMMEDN